VNYNEKEDEDKITAKEKIEEFNQLPNRDKRLGGLRALTYRKDSLIGQEIQIIEIKRAKVQDKEINVYTAKMGDNVIQFFGSGVMDAQVEKGEIKVGSFCTIDKIISKVSGNVYYSFIAIAK
jgi:hypothetical protein